MTVPYPKPQSVVGLFVGPHARERARERFPGFKAARIVDEVREAMVAGRISADPPPGIFSERTIGILFAWTPDGVRVYALAAWRDNTMVVMTTMRAMLAGGEA